MDVVNVENAGVFLHQLAYIHVGIQQEKVIITWPNNIAKTKRDFIGFHQIGFSIKPNP
jgi:hypothetical protein